MACRVALFSLAVQILRVPYADLMTNSVQRLHTGRLEAFSDGVLAIVLTIMVLDLHVPHATNVVALTALWPIFLSYLLSFVYIGIYWNNHHHLFMATKRVSGGILWANLHLLFWLSLVPFVTGWVGENNFAPLPVACYGVVLLMAAVAYMLLQTVILRHPDNRHLLGRALRHDWKGRLSPLLYIAGTLGAFWSPLFSCLLYAGVALIWLVPDRRIECAIVRDEAATPGN